MGTCEQVESIIQELQDLACPPLRKTLGAEAKPGKPLREKLRGNRYKQAWGRKETRGEL